MTINRESLIQNMMWKEVAQKSVAASFTFIFLAIVLYNYHWGVEIYVTPIRTSSILSIVSNIGRILIARKIEKEPTITPGNKRTLQLSIWMNTLAWSGIFTFGALALTMTSYHMAILVIMIAGFVGASIVTLSYDKSIFYPWQILILGPLIFHAVCDWLKYDNQEAFYLALCCFLFILYQMKQVRVYRQHIIERFNYQLDLEKALIETKDAQEALVNQTATLMHASKISGLGEMAGGLSHEVNNSLQVILGSSQQIQREFQKSGFTNPSIASKLENTIAATMKIKSVVDGLRYFSQEIDTGPKHVVPLKQIMDQTYVYTQELLKAHHVILTVDKIPDIDLNCHPFQITQVLFNLIKNADDAIRDIPEEKWIHLKFEEIRDYILIMVINSGPLITPEHQERLFQPFFSTKDVNLGTGLSLSISRGIALDHKGDLFYKNQEQFTTFVLKLPKA